MKLVLSLGPSRRMSAIVLALTTATLFHVQPFRPVAISGDSMEPTYHSGEVILAERYRGQAVHRGDLVVLRTPDGNLIKRVAYVGGDEVRQVFFEYWTDELTPVMVRYGELHSSFRTITIPKGHVYVRGDNAVDSIDSRQLGTFPVEDIELVALAAREPRRARSPLAAR